MLLSRLPTSYTCWTAAFLARHVSTLPRPPPLASLASQEDMRAARSWIAAYEQTRAEDFPRGKLTLDTQLAALQADPQVPFAEALEISYSRSSGPGGQNVNKLSTKATVRLPLDRASASIPSYALSNLRSCPHFVASPPALLLSASAHRTQPQNLQECFVKLKSTILAAAREGLVGETSEGQKKRVSELVRKDKKRTETVKKQRKDVKSGRRTGKGGWD